MDTSKTFRHKDYELQCTARAVDSGKFAPELVILRQVWPTRPRVIAVQRGNHLNQDDALEAARVQGVEWITNYG